MSGEMRPERRMAPRRNPPPDSWLATARVRPGHEVQVVNVSSRGVLVNARVRLLPGARVVVQFTGPGVALRAAAHVVRCHVAAIEGEQGLRYQSALAFDQPLDVFAHEGTPEALGYSVPNAPRDPLAEPGQRLPEAG